MDPSRPWFIASLIVWALSATLACGTANTPQPISTPTLVPPPTATASPAVEPSPTTHPTPTAPPPIPSGPNAAGVEPDPHWPAAVSAARFSTGGWKTEFAYHTVRYDELISGGPPRDGIPPLDEPNFISTADADQWLKPRQPVISLELNGESRAYPLQILMWHEIVNDEVGGEPVTVTFCPLCNSAIAFDRKLDGVVYDFGTSGNLRNSDLVMWDRQTESWWQQLTGEGIVGEMAGQTLRFLPASIVAWEDFRTSNPDGLVLSRDTGYPREYGANPYVGYDKVDYPPFFYFGELDYRLMPKERVAAVSLEGLELAFPFSVLREERVVNYHHQDQRLVVLFKPGVRSALDQMSINASREIGAAGVFDPVLDGVELTFELTDEEFRDLETGSTWNILGRAVAGPLAGEAMDRVVHGDHFWFAWAAFKPETIVYTGGE